MIFNKQILFPLLLVAAICACKKNDGNPPVGPVNSDLQYTDSVFYVTGQPQDYIVMPVKALVGTYGGFPDGIDIDEKTGAVNVSKSETGLKYIITFIPAGKADTLFTFVTISGINYLDGFYKLNTADSVAQPLYNANRGAAIPGVGSGSSFDVGSGCNSQGCNVLPVNGGINLAQTVRNGVFGKEPANNDRHEFELVYSVNDRSNKATNKLNVKLYYFKTMADVTQEAFDIIASRQGTIINAANPPALSLAVKRKAAKPRPPCIFIVGG